MYIQTMDVTDKTIPMSSDEGTVPVGEVAAEKGFFGMLVQSIFEPGANNAVILAMNVSFFLLLVVLFGLAFLTNWDFHVLMMLVVSTLLWASMIWFVIELQKTTNRPDNMPPDQIDASDAVTDTIASPSEAKKDR